MLQTHSTYSVRPAVESDLSRIEELCEAKRIEYQGYSPVFWNKAPNSLAAHLEYLKSLIKHPDTFLLVAEQKGVVEGFVIGAIASPPPVYNPGGKVCIIDDYNVASESLWDTVGKGLLRQAWQEGAKRGAVLVVVVCGQRDTPKRTMLQDSKLEVASEWFVGIPK
jgi:hypothetical protein